MKAKEDYEKLGWIFKEEKWTHPHRGEKMTEHLFVSPRMGKFCVYNNINTLDDREAECVALESFYLIKDSYQTKLFSMLKKYYSDNTQNINIPDFIFIVAE